ncbi:hypothetical protein B4U79_14523 [Dinothrombium tinctorium]|uniref:SCP domain-containing protein n=1 Tax=Dinothrombium tinctorium TaxID=1965070 RepID=A0A443RAA3_9ACAR|nr:hypothetical protein B4U79_14523 [Dinothrombium tinctorium]
MLKLNNISFFTNSIAVNDWYTEKSNYNWSTHTANHFGPKKGTVGHFTQLVWRSTRRLGCAMVISKGPIGGVFTTCVYHPVGNIASLRPQNVISIEKCKKIKESNLYVDLTNQTWLQSCLSIHNELRAKHGSPPLILDDKITEFARNRAIDMAKKDYANFGHNPKSPFGENLHWGKRKTGPAIKCEEPVLLWYREKRNYDWEQRMNHRGTYGHFTQIVWKNTMKLGCAQVLSKGIKAGTYTVCSYEPLGNIPTINAHEENVLPTLQDQSDEKMLTTEKLTNNDKKMKLKTSKKSSNELITQIFSTSSPLTTTTSTKMKTSATLEGPISVHSTEKSQL